MNPDGPYVSVAAICEKILTEKDGLISCIRFLDILNVMVHRDKPENPEAVPIKVNAFVAFKSGGFVGTKNIMLRLIGPSGKPGKLSKETPGIYPMVFTGAEQGYNLIVTLELPIKVSGLYWFDVTLDDEVYTRIPLRINLMWQNSPSQDESANSPQGSDPA